MCADSPLPWKVQAHSLLAVEVYACSSLVVRKSIQLTYVDPPAWTCNIHAIIPCSGNPVALDLLFHASTQLAWIIIVAVSNDPQQSPMAARWQRPASWDVNAQKPVCIVFPVSRLLQSTLSSIKFPHMSIFHQPASDKPNLQENVRFLGHV